MVPSPKRIKPSLYWIALTSALIACAQNPSIESPSASIQQRVPSALEESPRVVFLAFGDGGTGSQNQKNVAESMYKVCKVRKCEFALMLGDNIYENGVKSATDDQFEKKFEEPYSQFGRFNFWAIPGNHDHRGNLSAQVAYSGMSERWRMPARHFTISGTPDWLSIYAIDTSRLDSDQLDAMKASICEQKGWKILVGHHPIYSNGFHGGEKSLQKKVLPVMEACGVQIYFAGHDHHQEHITSKTFEQFIQGAAAKLRRVSQVQFRSGDTQRQNFAARKLGFSIAEVNPIQISVDFYDVDGREIYHWSATMDQIGKLPTNGAAP